MVGEGGFQVKRPEVPEAEIICVGYELLNGKTLNTNAQWLASQLTDLGFRVRRCTVVGDDTLDISAGVREALARGPKVLILTGGLGPTFDDKTLEGVAQALSLPLTINRRALKMVVEKYRKAELSFGKIPMTDARLKMARLPRGAKPLPNPVGTAPGVEIVHDSTRIYCLPGVPAEMTSIFNTSIRGSLQKMGAKLVRLEAWLKVLNMMESTMAPIIDRVMERYGVYIKSHPRSSEFENPWLEIQVVLEHTSEARGERILRSALRQLVQAVEREGGVVETIPR
jgi:nicotinamide-nucleotide amidase